MEDPDIFRDDLIFDETDEDPTPLDIPEESRKVQSQLFDLPIDTLDKWYRDGDLVVRPDFQRQFVWDAKKINRLIESVFLDFPIPVIYLVEEDDYKHTVIDGQQRICALLKFIHDKHQLKNLLVCKELDGKTWKELSKDQKRQFLNFRLRVVEISKNSHNDIRFEIFERLNTGSVKLNDQELRNCMYRGNFNDLLKELADNEDFQFIMDNPNDHTRMKDSEYILRFFAFYRNPYMKYKAPMKHFLNSEMEENKHLDPKEIEKLRLVFKKSVEVIRQIFGNKAFRLITLNNAMDPRSTKATRFNQGLFDILMNGFTYYDKRQVIPHAAAIAKELRYLSTYDVDFINAVTGTGTDSTQKVRKKFEIWQHALNKILNYPTNEPRAFSKQLKEQLFETDPVCAICHQPILDVDDAEVDHIYSYSKGGQTISSNASLTHRFCNRQKGDKELTTSAPITYYKPIPQNHESSVSKLQNEIQSHDTIKIPLKTEISDASSHSDNHNLSYKLTFKSLDKMSKDKILREHGGTSRKKYIFPILEYLVQNNGIISNKIAYQLIELKFGTDFTPVDFNFCKDGVTKKWEESLDWMKSDMKKSGMLKQEVRTEWKITEYGKECYERLKKNPSTIIKINGGIISFESP